MGLRAVFMQRPLEERLYFVAALNLFFVDFEGLAV
jgi:hypothetical protein